MIDRQFRISDYMHNLLKMKIKILQIFLLHGFYLVAALKGTSNTFHNTRDNIYIAGSSDTDHSNAR